MEQRKTNVKKIMLALIIAMLAIVGLTAYLILPSRYISLDVNPGMELHMNRLNQVVSVNPINEDAKQMLADFPTSEHNTGAVVKQLVSKLVENGYLGEDKQNDVLITSKTDSGSQKAMLEVGKDIKEVMNSQNLTANILTQSIAMDDDIAQRAAELNISAGKLKIIDDLLMKNPALADEDLAEDRISELAIYAKENDIPLEELEDLIEDRMDAERDAAEEAEDAAETEAEKAKDAEEDALEAAEEAAEAAAEAAKDAEDKAKDEADEATGAEEDALDTERDAAETAEDAQAESAEPAEPADDDADTD
ncbi:MAG: hypothetical protein RSA97_02505 [Oscillospiraceae bacterium]